MDLSEIEPSSDWKHRGVYDRIKDAIFALPSYFTSNITVEGLATHDLFSLNSVFATSIEESVVTTLNDMRSVWDPENEYADCSFYRRPQTFPDVVFARNHERGRLTPIMGIELKGWYLLSKEETPCFRYEVTPAACAPQDLLVVFTWSLNHVLNGEPELHEPYVTSAKRASRYVDYYWTEKRSTTNDTTISRPPHATPYPDPNERITDRPVADDGNNYGRVARTDMMSDYTTRMLETELAGKSASEWIQFLKEPTPTPTHVFADPPSDEFVSYDSATTRSSLDY